jgi:hypothetical protein
MRRGLLLLRDWKHALGDTGSGAERFLADYTAERPSASSESEREAGVAT